MNEYECSGSKSVFNWNDSTLGTVSLSNLHSLKYLITEHSGSNGIDPLDVMRFFHDETMNRAKTSQHGTTSTSRLLLSARFPLTDHRNVSNVLEGNKKRRKFSQTLEVVAHVLSADLSSGWSGEPSALSRWPLRSSSFLLSKTEAAIFHLCRLRPDEWKAAVLIWCRF